jgi:general secretion pathway protein D
MRSLYLPLLLSIPLTLAAQETRTQLSPSLRDKLLAQNTAGQPAATPAGAPAVQPAAVPDADEIPTPVPPTAVPPAGNAQPPANVPPPTTTNPPRIPVPRPANTPAAPRIPGSRTPLPGANSPSANVFPLGANSGAEAPPPDPNNPWGDIAFVDADINEVLDKYMEITQRHVLRPPDLAAKINLVANPNPLKPFTREEAAEFIKAGLALQNITIQKYNDTTDKVLMLAERPLTNGSAKGEPIYTRAEDLPEEDIVVNFVLVLKHLPVTEASQVLAQAVPVRKWTQYIAVPSANAIFIQEYTSNIRTLVKVAKGLDLPPIKMIHEWVELERASAEDVQTILDQILQAQNQGRSGGAGQGGVRTISPAAAAANLAPGAPNVPVSMGTPGASSGAMPDGSQVIVKADPRTNRVFLNGPEEHVKFLRTLIREFDEPSRVKNLLTQQLRYIPVNDFFGLAVTSLEATGAGSAGGGSAGGAGAGGAGGARNTGGRNDSGGGGGDFRSNFANRSGGGANTNQFSGGGGGGGGRTTSSARTGGGGGAGSTGGQFEAPQAQTVGKTLLNSLIVSGPPDSIQRVSDLVKEMDRRPFQVHINAVIAQMALGDDMTSNVDILRQPSTVNVLGRAVNTAGFWRTGSSGSFIDPTSLGTLANIPAVSGFNFYAAADDLFNAYVRLLETSNRSKLLAKPHITVANNEMGTISSGRRVPIPSNQQSTVVAGGTTSLNSSVEYENVVLSLDITPLINSRNEITLTVAQLNDVIDGSTNISGNDIPIISTQELNTKVTIPNGAILVLGGLIQESQTRTNSGIPILSKIPVLKYLVGSNNKKKERRELVVLLQARIIENADDMVDVNVSEIQRTVIGPEAERFAKPDRNTDNVKLPTFESDVPFNHSTTILETTAPPVRKTRSRK